MPEFHLKKSKEIKKSAFNGLTAAETSRAAVLSP